MQPPVLGNCGWLEGLSPCLNRSQNKCLTSPLPRVGALLAVRAVARAPSTCPRFIRNRTPPCKTGNKSPQPGGPSSASAKVVWGVAVKIYPIGSSLSLSFSLGGFRASGVTSQATAKSRHGVGKPTPRGSLAAGESRDVRGVLRAIFRATLQPFRELAPGLCPCPALLRGELATPGGSR